MLVPLSCLLLPNPFIRLLYVVGGSHIMVMRVSCQSYAQRFNSSVNHLFSSNGSCCSLHTSHIDIEPWKLLGPLDMFLGWLVLIVRQTSVDTLQVQLYGQVSLLQQQRLAFQHCERGKKMIFYLHHYPHLVAGSL